MFTAALFTITKVWKQTKCPSVNEWIKKRDCIHTYIGIIFSLKKKKENSAICNNKDARHRRTVAIRELI